MRRINLLENLREQRRDLEEDFAYSYLLSSGERAAHQAFLLTLCGCVVVFAFQWTHPILAILTCFVLALLEHLCLYATLRQRLAKCGVESEWDEQEYAYQLIFRGAQK